MLTMQTLQDYLLNDAPVETLLTSLNRWRDDASMIENNIEMFRYGYMNRAVTVEHINVSIKLLIVALPSKNPLHIYQVLQSHSILNIVSIRDLFSFFANIDNNYDYEGIAEVVETAYDLHQSNALEFMFETEYFEMGEQYFTDDECNYNKSSAYVDWDEYCRDIFNYPSFHVEMPKSLHYCGNIYAAPSQ